MSVPCCIDCPPWKHEHKTIVNLKGEEEIISMTLPPGFTSFTDAMMNHDRGEFRGVPAKYLYLPAELQEVGEMVGDGAIPAGWHIDNYANWWWIGAWPHGDEGPGPSPSDSAAWSQV